MSASRRGLGVRFDLLAGSLLLIMVLAGCVAIRMLQQTAGGHSFELTLWASWAQLALVFGGLGMLLALSFLVRQLVSTPLSRMTAHVHVMQQTGRLVKMPVTGSEELAAFAATFNELAERIEEQKARLREHIVELQVGSAEMERLAGMKDDFLATISHQFRTPLTSLMEGVELLQDGAMGPVPEEAKRLLRIMNDGVTRLDHLIEEALDLALMKSGRRLLNRRPAALDALLTQTAQAWRAAAKGQELVLSCPALPQVYLDPEAIREVMDHLLRNALRHTPDGGCVRIEAQVGPEMVRVAVSDTGPGLTGDQLTKLFQPFTHVHTPEAPGSEGGGLGLAICRQVLERHHGRIHAESAPGQGMAVIFELPVATETFLFAEACRGAHEDAQHEHGLFAVLAVVPDDGAPGARQALMEQAERLLRRNTHRGDRFARLSDDRLAIVAVTDQLGGRAMTERLGAVLRGAGLAVRLGIAYSPLDGDTHERVLAVAVSRARGSSAGAPRVTMAASEQPAAPRGGAHG